MDEAYAAGRRAFDAAKYLKIAVLKSPAVTVLELIQIAIRNKKLPLSFRDDLAAILESPRTSYRFDKNPPTIIPLGSPEERDRVTCDLREAESSPLVGAYSHLRKSGVELTGGNYRDAIREAVHAVESATRHVSGKPNATLTDALRVIRKTHPVHSALEKAIEKLYAYASDENGIRHALLDSENERVGKEEALFMFSACTAFVAFLIRKSTATH